MVISKQQAGSKQFLLSYSDKKKRYEEYECDYEVLMEPNEMEDPSSIQSDAKKRRINEYKNNSILSPINSESIPENKTCVDLAMILCAIDNLQMLMTQIVSKTDELYNDIQELKSHKNLKLKQNFKEELLLSDSRVSPSTKEELYEQKVIKISYEPNQSNNSEHILDKNEITYTLTEESCASNSVELIKSVLEEVKILRADVNRNKCKCHTSALLEKTIRNQRLNLPASSADEFNDLEKQINEDNSKMSLFINLIRSIDGTTHEKYIRECLRRIITDEAACIFSWHGQRDNIAIKSFTICNILKEETSSRYPNIRPGDMGYIIKKWFQYAKDRCNKRNLKPKTQDSLLKITQVSEEELQMLSKNTDLHAPPNLLSVQGVSFPATSAEEFQYLERQVNENSETAIMFTKRLQSINALKIEKYIRICLRKIITDEAACFFSWFGQRNNIAVKDFTTMNVLKEETMCKFTYALECFIEDIIKKWFQYAKDRHHKKQKLNEYEII